VNVEEEWFDVAGRVSRIIVVDDEVIRAGVVAILQREEDFDVVASVGSAEDVPHSIDFGIAVVGYRVRGVNGALVCREILDRHPHTAVVILSPAVDDTSVQVCLSAGAKGYLLRDALGTELSQAIRAVAKGETVLAPSVVGRVVDWVRDPSAQARTRRLALQEVLVLSLTSLGLTTRAIASRLAVSEGSVRLYLKSAMRKLGVRERSQAVATAIRQGVI
jgi:DNA-binding NarL/FixJ family response regulator